MKIRQDREILQRLEEWKNERPLPPVGERPELKVSSGVLVVILTIIGGISGIIILALAPAVVYSNPGQDIGAAVSFLFLAPFIGAATGFTGGLIIFLIDSVFEFAIYSYRLRRKGWHDYDIADREWKLTGEENFGELAYTNPRVAMTLGILIDKSYMDRHEKLR